jgi:hypothetical protein
MPVDLKNRNNDAGHLIRQYVLKYAAFDFGYWESTVGEGFGGLAESRYVMEYILYRSFAGCKCWDRKFNKKVP